MFNKTLSLSIININLQSPKKISLTVSPPFCDKPNKCLINLIKYLKPYVIPLIKYLTKITKL